jgi:hypothetical protein
MMRAFPAWAENATESYGEPRKEGEMPPSTILELPEQELGEEEWKDEDEEFDAEQELDLDEYDDIDEDDDDSEL